MYTVHITQPILVQSRGSEEISECHSVAMSNITAGGMYCSITHTRGETRMSYNGEIADEII